MPLTPAEIQLVQRSKVLVVCGRDGAPFADGPREQRRVGLLTEADFSCSYDVVTSPAELFSDRSAQMLVEQQPHSERTARRRSQTASASAASASLRSIQRSTSSRYWP